MTLTSAAHRGTPSRLHFGDDAIEQMRLRVRATRWPRHQAPENWMAGTDPHWLRELLGHWGHAFDWRAQEERLNRYPQYTLDRPGTRLHYLHIAGEGAAPRPLLLLHGWPGSVFEFEKIIPLLTAPSRFGGQACDAFTLVLPCLPGFGASHAPGLAGQSIEEMAEAFGLLMREGWGYTRYGVQGGDLGASIATTMGLQRPDEIAGIHLNFLPLPRTLDTTPDDAESTEYNGQLSRWLAQEAAYGAIQSTKPETLAMALNDSPAGLAAWISEKLRTWSDCGGDIESVFAKDDILANVSLYWLSETIGTSFYPYYWRHLKGWPFGPGNPVSCPMGYSAFPKEVLRPPRSLAARTYRNILTWTEQPAGGHFAAWEQPDALAKDIRRFFARAC